MTNEEAIRNIKMHIAEMMVSLQDTDEHLEAEQIAIEALEKQIPKKPISNGGFTRTWYNREFYHTCPTCGNQFLKMRMTERQDTLCCWECGQAIDWSDCE